MELNIINTTMIKFFCGSNQCMSEIISLHIGQAGVQIGDACWELFCSEHGIEKDGKMKEGCTPSGGTSIFYNETEHAKFTPRCCFIDTEPDIIDKICFGDTKKLYHTGHMIKGKEDASNLFSVARFTLSRDILEECYDSIRRLSENCDSFQGFLLFHSTGGGTGSGMSAALREHLRFHYNRPIFNYSVYPSGSGAIVEPYNAAFATYEQMEDSAATFIFDNKALFDVCTDQMHLDRPCYSDINAIIAQVVSSSTVPMRFTGEMNLRMEDIRTNLIPYEGSNFILSSYSPFVSQSAESIDAEQLTNMAFRRDNVLATCDPQKGKYIACCLFYQGNVSPGEASLAIEQTKAKSSVQFVDWCPTGFKYSVHSDPINSSIHNQDKSLCMHSNSTSLQDFFFRITKNFDLLYSKRAFIHWYAGCGMSKGIMSEVRYQLDVLHEKYNIM